MDLLGTAFRTGPPRIVLTSKQLVSIHVILLHVCTAAVFAFQSSIRLYRSLLLCPPNRTMLRSNLVTLLVFVIGLAIAFALDEQKFSFKDWALRVFMFDMMLIMAVTSVVALLARIRARPPAR